MKPIADFINKATYGNTIDLIKCVPNNSINLIIADPPYLTTNKKWDKDDIIDDELINEYHRVLKDSGNLYVFCGIGEKSQSLIRWFPIFSKRFHFKDLITWKKQRGIGMRRGWLYTREEMMWLVKDNDKFIWNEKYQYSDEKRQQYGFKKNGISVNDLCKSDLKRLTNVWTDIKETTFNGTFGEQKSLVGGHFTPKPIELIDRILKAHTNKNDIVLDSFSGSGNVLFACQLNNRNFIGFEKEPKYVEFINKKLIEYQHEQVKPIANTVTL